MFFGGPGSCFSGFLCLENKLEKCLIFDHVTDPKPGGWGVVICTGFGPWKQLTADSLIVTSMTDNC